MSDSASLREEFGQLLSDIDFLELHQRLLAPNVFRIFQMEYVEAKHSAFLAWLLDPNESHGLEDEFLRRFLAAALASPPPERGRPADEISPIPYEAVSERMLGWDRMDILSADLRESNISTDLCRRSDGKRIDIAIWNEPYSFVVYIENRVSPRHSWRLCRGSGRQAREHDSERCLLDLYSQWGADDAGGYEILPVFLSLGDLAPTETRCFHQINYSWMPSFLERLAQSPTVSSRAAALIRDFCEWLRLEKPEELAPDLWEKLSELTKKYGRIICRMAEHVAECNGCEESDILGGFHDVYRRHRHIIDYLSHFAESVPDSKVEELRGKIEPALDGSEVVFEQGPAVLSAHSKNWERKIPREGMRGIEVFASVRCRGCGVVVYTEALTGMLDRVLAAAEEVAKENEIDIIRPERATRNFRLLRFMYDEFDPAQAAKDFLQCWQLVDKTFEKLS